MTQTIVVTGAFSGSGRALAMDGPSVVPRFERVRVHRRSPREIAEVELASVAVAGAFA
jgi:hypothetical protein